MYDLSRHFIPTSLCMKKRDSKLRKKLNVTLISRKSFLRDILQGLKVRKLVLKKYKFYRVGLWGKWGGWTKRQTRSLGEDEELEEMAE